MDKLDLRVPTVEINRMDQRSMNSGTVERSVRLPSSGALIRVVNVVFNTLKTDLTPSLSFATQCNTSRRVPPRGVEPLLPD